MITSTIFPTSNKDCRGSTPDFIIERCTHCGDRVEPGRTLCDVCRKVPYTIVNNPARNDYPYGQPGWTPDLPGYPNYPQITYGPGNDMPTCNGKPITAKELPGYRGHSGDFRYVQ